MQVDFRVFQHRRLLVFLIQGCIYFFFVLCVIFGLHLNLPLLICCRFCTVAPMVAHSCHGKTKSHGTTNFTHGKTKLSHGKTKLTHGKTKSTHGKTKFTHGKTEKTSWSAVGQRLLFFISNGMSCNNNTLLARKTAIFNSLLRACARASCRYDVRTALARSLDRLVDSGKLFFDFRLWSAFDSFGRVINEMVTFVAKNSGGVKKKPMMILKDFIFFSF